MTKVAPYQFQKHESTFCLSKTRMKPVLYISMNRILLLSLNVLPINSLFLPLNVLPISHLLLSINVLPISYLLLPLNILPISHLLLLLLVVLPISHPNLLLLPQLLYPKILRNGSKTQ